MKIVTKTNRLNLREAILKDWGFIHELVNTAKWKKHIGDRGIYDQAATENYINNSLINSYKVNGYGLFVMELKEENKSIGICGLVNRPGLNHPDLGFAILPEFERLGLTFEASKEIIEWAKNKLSFTTLLAITSPENIASQKLLEKLNFKDRKLIRLKSNETESVLYTMKLNSLE